MTMDPKQVHMAPFGLIFIQDGSHKLWEASGMPPGPQNATEKSPNPGFPCFSIFSSIFMYFPIIPQQQHHHKVKGPSLSDPPRKDGAPEAWAQGAWAQDPAPGPEGQACCS